MDLIEEIKQCGDVRNGGCVLTMDADGFHMRESRDIFGPHRHDLPADVSADRLRAHWDGFVANVRNR